MARVETYTENWRKWEVLRERPAAPRVIRGPDDVLAELDGFASLEREHFVALMLNGRHEVIVRETISIGSAGASIVHPREAFRPAISAGACAILFAHNHPSGDPEPSTEDLAITKRLVAAGELLGIGVLDHVIVAKRGSVSLRERGKV
jgi:DNA repair protein RadC